MSAKKAAIPAGNVVQMPQRLTGAHAIAAAVLARSRREDEAFRRGMEDTIAALDARHRATAQQLVPLGTRMTHAMLLDFLEIGRQMLSGRAGA